MPSRLVPPSVLISVAVHGLKATYATTLRSSRSPKVSCATSARQGYNFFHRKHPMSQHVENSIVRRRTIPRRTALRLAFASVPAIAAMGTTAIARASPPPSVEIIDAVSNSIQGGDWPALPLYPSVSYASLYRTGDKLRDVMARVPTYNLLTLPNGFDEEFSDFSMTNNFGLIYLNVRGIVGNGPDHARIRLARKSSTKGPNEGCTMMRLMDGRNGQNIISGFSLEGTDQPEKVHSQGNELRPHNFSGLLVYYGRNAILQNLRVSGIGGNWNSPPGETFAINLYKDIGTTLRGVEVTGFNVDGQQVGGSPCGLNNSTDVTIEDSNFHDSFVSGLTGSFAGNGLNPATATTGWYTKNVKIARNANNAVAGSGKRFTGINHENVNGKVVHEYDDFSFNNPTSYWDQTHIALNNMVFDNADVQIIEPAYQTLHKFWNGCFVVQILNQYPSGTPNKQVSPPKVVKNGRVLTPVHQTGNPGKILNVDPKTSYIVLH